MSGQPAAPPADAASSASAGALGTCVRYLPPLALILLATTWPISDFQDHAHWHAVEWIPFTVYRRSFDVVANVMLFVPLGAAFTWGHTARGRVRQALYIGLLLALGVELSQVFTHNRAATTTDVIANTTGAWLGARWALARSRARGAPG